MSKDYSVFEAMIHKYSQQNLDPQSLQVGQQVYTPEGEVMTVIENPADTTTKTLMPADQQGSQLPQGVQTVEDTDLASQYSLQPPNGTQPATGATPATTARKRAQEELTVNWNDIQDIVSDLNSAVQQKNMQKVMECLEDLTDMALMNINMPSDMKMTASNIFEDFAREL